MTTPVSRMPEYGAWVNMRSRCGNPKNAGYKDYGGRGICVCERWQNFEAFYRDVGPRPSDKHSIDRYPNNDGNYEPGNVRWATIKEQANNRRPRAYPPPRRTSTVRRTHHCVFRCTEDEAKLLRRLCCEMDRGIGSVIRVALRELARQVLPNEGASK